MSYYFYSVFMAHEIEIICILHNLCIVFHISCAELGGACDTSCQSPVLPGWFLSRRSFLQRVMAWRANSSLTTSRDSWLPVRKIQQLGCHHGTAMSFLAMSQHLCRLEVLLIPRNSFACVSGNGNIHLGPGLRFAWGVGCERAFRRRPTKSSVFHWWFNCFKDVSLCLWLVWLSWSLFVFLRSSFMPPEWYSAVKVVAISLHWLPTPPVQLSMAECLAFGAMISSTDPVTGQLIFRFFLQNGWEFR